MSYGFTITVKGREFLAKQVAGEQLKITRVMVGSGKVSEDTNPAYMTDLVKPIAQATSTVPVQKKDTVSFIVEYRNDMNDGLKKGFWIREFGVFVRDGEDEILIYYATLGDFPQYVMAYEYGRVDIRRYPVTLKISDEIEVILEYPALAFVTEERFWELIQIKAIPYLQKVIESGTLQRDIVIPTTGWLENVEGGEGGVYIDIVQKDVTENMIPIVSIYPNDMSAARGCGMNTTVQTINGAVRFFADKIPKKEIKASLVLLKAYHGIAGEITGDGNGIDIEAFYKNYVATNEEVEKVLNEVFEK